jgi:hypothetical protein
MFDTLSGSQHGHAGLRTPGACCSCKRRLEDETLSIRLATACCRLQSFVEGALATTAIVGLPLVTIKDGPCEYLVSR